MENLFDHRLQISKIFAPIAGNDDEKFGFLPLRQLEKDWKVPFNIYLKIKTKDNPNGDFTICCHQNQIFQGEWKLKLEKLNIPGIYYSMDEEEEVIKYLNSNLSIYLEKEMGTYEEKVNNVCDVTLVWLRHFFVKNQARTSKNLEMGQNLVDALWDTITKEKIISSFITDIWRHGQSLYTHSMNVCILGIAFLAYLGWPEKKAKNFGLGALLHDIGMTKIPQEVLTKSPPLTDEDWNNIKKHPIRGLHILKRYIDLPWDVLLMIAQHHENGDGSGYPDELQLNKIHPWARILRIIDSYEAMTSERVWRDAKIPKDALFDMKSDWEFHLIYDTRYFKFFIKFLAGT